ncbi:PQQ-binding-like beta-propeller repeat protein [Natronorubrum bangense]|uniref:Serine/threonine protein kinase n=1 Tax=Natronorubrum bangense TaxID=61858 RepID=A0A4D6HM71_9EURY|nr:PQQ-binding-like beta-propeller repeat protein [Natronorubrum bangense]QCC55033.1 serine/threonine protein kinase [Natronorubrum bangense]
MRPPLTRRRLLGVAGGSLLGGYLLGPRAGGSDHVDPTVDGEWLHPRADSRNVASTADPGPGGDGRIEWEQTLEARRRYEHAGFALVDDTLLVPTHHSLRTLDAETGTTRWQYAYQRPSARHNEQTQLDSEPQVRDGVVYLVFQTTVCALDLETRRLRWRCDLNSSADGCWLFGTTLYVTARVDSEYRLVALDAETGLERWRRTARDSVLAAGSGLVVVADYDAGRVTGLVPETGTERWVSDTAVSASSLSRGEVVIVDDYVFVITADGDLTALEAATGDRRWTISGGTDEHTMMDTLAVDPSARAVYWSQPDKGTIAQFDIMGELVWETDRNSLEFGISVGNGTVYASTANGLLALEADTGDERFRVSPVSVGDSSPGCTPLIAGNQVYHCLGETIYEVGSR